MKQFNYFDFANLPTEEEIREIQEMLARLSGKETEVYYRALMQKGTCKTKNAKIACLDFLSYAVELRTQWNYFLMQHMDETVKAIYFEFDTLLRWSGQFVGCSSYMPLAEENDDWASDCICAQGDAPDYELLAIVYNGCCDKCMGGTNNKKALIALTAALFKQIVEMNNPHVPVCIHYKYQDPLFRLFEDSQYTL
ncbi:MAG: hypothetical protein RR336_05870 [Oscillospiraceae bacterium]